MTTPNLACFHCGLPIYSRENRTEIAGIEQSFCCMGCLAAATTIEGCGLSDFYKYRQSYNDNAESYNLRQNSESLAYDNLTIQKSFVTSNPDNTLSFSLQIEGITCAACVWLIEHSLLKLDGLHQVVLNLSTHRLSIILESDTTPLSEIFNHIQALGYGAKPWKPGNHDHLDKLQKDFLIRIGISGIGLMQVMMNTFAMYLGDIELQHETILRWASLFLTLPVVLYAAAPFYKAAIRDLKSRHFGMDIPVSLALILAFIPSVWATIQQSGDTYYESVVMFTFFLLLGRYLEFRTRLHLDNFNNGIDDLIPALAHKYDNELVIDTPSINLNPGDVIEIRPGEQIPADGIVIEGNSQINEASITGEFKPVIATVDYLVKAGTINTDGLLKVRVSHDSKQSTVSQMIFLLEKAASQRPKIAELADKGASYFVIMVLLLSLFTGVSWYFIEPSKAFWIAISVLVITCPCALSLATPVSITSSTTALRKSGILPTNGQALTETPHLTSVIFDKTGTLTNGQYSIKQLVNLSQYSDELILATAAALESHSEHPLAKPFAKIPGNISIQQATVVANKGISGIVNNEEYRIGTINFCLEETVNYPDANQWIALSNYTTQKLLAWIAISDDIRPDAQQTINMLKQRGLDVFLLTGDPSEHGQAVGHQLGISNIHTGLSALDKVNMIRTLQESNRSVLMIGDGINDAPALSIANVSIAMSQGTELTKNSADILLLRNKLLPIIDAIKIADKTIKIIKQNLTWGLLYNIIALPFAMAGLVSPWVAAIGMSFSSLLVVFNALRLTRKIK